MEDDMAISPTTRQQLIAEVLPHLAELRRFAYSLTRNWADADDLLQDTMARAMVKMHLWEPGTRIVPWLAVMMRNIRRSAYSRAWNKVQWCELEDFDSVAAAQQFDTVALNETRKLWSAMPPHQREILELIALDGLSYEDAADHLGIPVGTVRSRLSRARDALRLSVFGSESPEGLNAGAPGRERRAADTRSHSRRGRAQTGPIPEPAVHPARSDRTVMLVEDEIWLAMALEEVVRDAGFKVIGPVGRLEDAIELAGSQTIDAAVLDIRLDREMVFPVADILLGKDIPFAFVTAFPESEIQLPHRSRPVWSKPIDRPRFQHDLKALLDGRSAGTT
jgi:RNA polymerase sigma-70 factor (ECF subfamily)